MKAFLELSRADRNGAFQTLSHLLARHPDSMRGRFYLSKYLLLQGRTLEAEEQLRAVVASHPQFLEAKINLVSLLKARGGFQEAWNFILDLDFTFLKN